MSSNPTIDAARRFTERNQNGRAEGGEKQEKWEKKEKKDFGKTPFLPDAEPFPTEILPQKAQSFVLFGALSRGIAADFIANPLLGTVAAATGDRVSLEIKRGWNERANIWVPVVGHPGTGKSPGVDYAMEPIVSLQARMWQRYKDEHANDETSKARLQSIFTTDATIEAVGMVLQESRGLALHYDEVAGWVQSFDQYHKGGDRQKWLGVWSGGPWKSDRKTSDPVFIRTPVIAIIGGTQPERLPDLRGSVINDGFLDRFWLAYPEEEMVLWSEDEDDVDAVEAWTTVITTLHNHWVADPITTHLTDQARRVWADFVNKNAEVTRDATGLAKGWSSKAPRHLAKAALLLHCMKHPGDPGLDVTAPTMESAVILVDYYRAHFIRCLPEMRASGQADPAGDPGRILRQLRKAAPTDPWMSRSALLDRTKIGPARFELSITYLHDHDRITERLVKTATKDRQEFCIVGSVDEEEE